MFDDFVLVADAFFVEDLFALSCDLLPSDDCGMLGKVSVENNGIASLNKGITEVSEESDWSNAINTKISGRCVAVVSADTVNNAWIRLIDIVNDQDSLCANRDNMELSVWNNLRKVFKLKLILIHKS